MYVCACTCACVRECMYAWCAPAVFKYVYVVYAQVCKYVCARACARHLCARAHVVWSISGRPIPIVQDVHISCFYMFVSSPPLSFTGSSSARLFTECLLLSYFMAIINASHCGNDINPNVVHVGHPGFLFEDCYSVQEEERRANIG